jgi:hypothetical protein
MTDYQNTSIPGFVSERGAEAPAHPGDGHRKANRPWFKKKRFTLLTVVILLMLIIWGANDRGDIWTSHTVKSGSQVTATSAPQAKAAAAGIGTKVRDGGYNFVVTGVEHPGKTLAGKVGETLTAQGEFVIVLVNVTNLGNKEQTPGCSYQILKNDKGQTFRPNSGILRTKEALKFVQFIKPGKTVNGFVMLFDVPPGTNVASIELHDSPQTPGVNVKLS